MPTILRTVLAALAGTAVLVILALAAEHANAVDAGTFDGRCGSFQAAMRYVREHYDEGIEFIAERGDGIVISITVNQKTGTWTMWGQSSAERICAIGAGDLWGPASDAVRGVAPPGRPL